MTQDCHVYIMASHTRTLYVGVTSDLEQRVRQHKAKVFDGFKGLLRKKKIKMIEEMNPFWDDLAEEWFEIEP